MKERGVSDGTAGSSELSSIAVLREQRRAGLNGVPALDTRGSILEALERILGEVSLHEVSVAQIVDEAQVSRKAFYSYFESKYEAAGAVLAQVMEAMYERWLPFLELRAEGDPLTLLQGVLVESHKLWIEHAAIARALHEYWQSVPELGTQWLAALERFTTGVAAAIDDARAAGLLPPGADSRQIAAAGLWTGEQLMYVMRSGRSRDLPDVDSVFESSLNVWAGLLYGRQVGGGAV